MVSEALILGSLRLFMYRTFNCKLDLIFLKSLCNVSKHVSAINIWLPCEKFYTEDTSNMCLAPSR